MVVLSWFIFGVFLIKEFWHESVIYKFVLCLQKIFYIYISLYHSLFIHKPKISEFSA